MAEIARHVRIYGQVQGVFFRAWTRDQAEQLGVNGWVRNCPDGRVEANIEGAESEVEDMIECMRCGPPAALVENLRVWNADNCDFESFDVRH